MSVLRTPDGTQPNGLGHYYSYAILLADLAASSANTRGLMLRKVVARFASTGLISTTSSTPQSYMVQLARLSNDLATTDVFPATPCIPLSRTDNITLTMNYPYDEGRYYKPGDPQIAFAVMIFNPAATAATAAQVEVVLDCFWDINKYDTPSLAAPNAAPL
jgi:hypothetical protein